MTSAFNWIDQYAKATGAAWVLVHHASKGNQAQKSVTDVGAGAGSQSRAVDCHCVLRAHEEPDHVVMESRVRSFLPPKPKVLKWEFPLWRVIEDADPTALRDPTKKSSTGKVERHRKQIVQAVTDQPDSLSSLKLRLKGMVPRDDIAVLLGQLVVEGVLTITPGRKANNKCDIYSLAEMSA